MVRSLSASTMGPISASLLPNTDLEKSSTTYPIGMKMLPIGPSCSERKRSRTGRQVSTSRRSARFHFPIAVVNFFSFDFVSFFKFYLNWPLRKTRHQDKLPGCGRMLAITTFPQTSISPSAHSLRECGRNSSITYLLLLFSFFFSRFPGPSFAAQVSSPSP